MNSNLKTLAVLASGCFVTFAVTAQKAQAAILVVQTIDPFNVSQTISNAGGSNVIGPSAVAIDSSLLGNGITRTISGTITAGSNPANSVTVDVNESLPDTFAIANAPGRRSNVNTSYSFTGAKDFTVGGAANSILLQIIENDTPMTVRFHFTDSDGTIGILTATTPGGIAGSPVGQALAFSNTGSITGGDGILDFTQITGFNVDTNANLFNSSDIILDFVSVGREIPSNSIPEPSSIVALLSVGLLGGAIRKKKQN